MPDFGDFKNMPPPPPLQADDIPIVEYWNAYLATLTLNMPEERKILEEYTRKRIQKLIELIQSRKST
jgi:hypothetical protein